MYVERVKQFQAWQTDGTEANARQIISEAYTKPIYRPEDLIRWKSLPDNKSYFTVVIFVKKGKEPQTEWETEPGDWIVKGEDGRFEIFNDVEFLDHFKKVDE